MRACYLNNVTIVRTLHLRTTGRQSIRTPEPIKPVSVTSHPPAKKATVISTSPPPHTQNLTFFSRVYLRRHHCVRRGSHRVVVLLERRCGNRLSSDRVHQRGLPVLRRPDRQPFEGSVHGLVRGTDRTRSLPRLLMR